MPQIFKVGSYVIYFWTNENKPLEPIHVHISPGIPTDNKNLDYTNWKMCGHE